ncbi:hypothetical protein [Amycolatopsis sp. NPDC051372]|uniref:hypothetical protein n=1 Tax=Amycolatopsis sp. NPDC051372 TaxID=3155669 RepID=UPI003416A5D1
MAAGNPCASSAHPGLPASDEAEPTLLDDLQKRSEDCTTAGKLAIDVTQLQARTDVNLALTAERAQGELAGSPVIDYAAKQAGGQGSRRPRRPTANGNLREAHPRPVEANVAGAAWPGTAA